MCAYYDSMIKLQREELEALKLDGVDSEKVEKIKIDLFNAHENLLTAKLEVQEFSNKVSGLDQKIMLNQEGILDRNSCA